MPSAEVYNKLKFKKGLILQVLYNFNVLKKTRVLNINLSATLEQALKDKLKSIESKKWVKENKKAIKAYNDFVDANGCFGDEYREF